ncbi:transposable element Tcb2 transposase [Trichonephila clavipes]|nr:transposable element Tcb2 transposase [Trichonephila clavipes]
MPLRRFRRQYEQQSQFERGKIIDMMEAVWLARRVARQLGHSDCVAQVAPSLGAPVSSGTIRRRIAKKHLGSRCPLHEMPLTPTHLRLRLEWCRARGNYCIGMEPGRL